MEFTKLTKEEWQALSKSLSFYEYLTKGLNDTKLPPSFLIRVGSNIFASPLRWDEIKQQGYFTPPSYPYSYYINDPEISEVYRLDSEQVLDHP